MNQDEEDLEQFEDFIGTKQGGSKIEKSRRVERRDHSGRRWFCHTMIEFNGGDVCICCGWLNLSIAHVWVARVPDLIIYNFWLMRDAGWKIYYFYTLIFDFKSCFNRGKRSLCNFMGTRVVSILPEQIETSERILSISARGFDMI